MDSLNLSETQKASLNSKNTASNTSPIACACCGSKYYIQILPQPYCFRVQQPEIPRCKHPRECFEENFTKPQPQGFSPFLPFPVVHPFFPNSSLSVNSTYPYTDSTANAEKDNRENIPHLSKKDKFCPREKNEFKGSKTNINENAQKYTNVPGPELPFLGQPFNFIDPHLNSVFTPCGSGDFIPWGCSPFIAPMISYCLFWNSLKFGGNNPFKCYMGHSADTETQKNKENTNQTYSNANDENKSIQRECVNKVVSSTEIKSFTQEECMEVENYDNNQSSENSELENGFKNVEKEEEMVAYLKTSSDSCCEGEEDAEMEGFDSAVQVESDECFQIDGKDLSNYKTASCLSIEPNNEMRNDSRGETEISYLMKSRNENASDVPMSEMQINSSDASVTDENAFLSFQDQTNDPFLSETKISTAAAGDLGGENCEGYKMIIDAFEKDAEEKTCKQNELIGGTEPKEVEMQDFQNLQKSNLTVTGKSPNENSRSARGFQSGIAKLSINSKPKNSKTDTKKNSKYNKESSQKERDFTKRKHSCIFNNNNNNNVNSNDNSSKIQKTRNCTGVQQQITGPVKQQKETMRRLSLTRKKKNFSD